MGYTHGTTVDSKTRICTKCNREYPNTNEYFAYANKKAGRLSAVCKTCQAKINKEKRLEIIERNKGKDLFYEGTRHCKNCGRDLPNNKLYFSIDLSCVDGLRSVCRECNKKEAGFLSPDYKPNERWTKDEDELMIQYYHDYTGKELKKKFFQNRTVRAIECHADELNIAWKTEETYWRSRKEQGKIVSKKLKGRKMSEDTKKKLSENRKEYYKTHTPFWKGKKLTPQQCKAISDRNTRLGKWKGENNPRFLHPLSGSDNPNWQGGITNFYQELRSDTKDWFNNSAKFCNYNCVISGLNFDNVHHTTPFKEIVHDTLKLTGIDQRRTVSDYTEEEFDNLTDTLKYLHNEYGYGACIIKDVHVLFHNTYGYKDFSPYDFLDFVYRIDVGEFDNWFKGNNLPIDINYEYVEYLESTLSALDLSA